MILLRLLRKFAQPENLRQLNKLARKRPCSSFLRDERFLQLLGRLLIVFDAPKNDLIERHSSTSQQKHIERYEQSFDFAEQRFNGFIEGGAIRIFLSLTLHKRTTCQLHYTQLALTRPLLRAALANTTIKIEQQQQSAQYRCSILSSGLPHLGTSAQHAHTHTKMALQPQINTETPPFGSPGPPDPPPTRAKAEQQ